jgi:hypothetical protein
MKKLVAWTLAAGHPHVDIFENFELKLFREVKVKEPEVSACHHFRH